MDYYIVCIKEENGVIKNVGIRCNLTGKLAIVFFARKRVVKDIDAGAKVFTAYAYNTDTGYKKGVQVHVVDIKEEKYLRTDKNKITSDNLGELRNCN